MWSVMNYLDEINRNLVQQGFLYEVPQEKFKLEMKRATGVFNDDTINKWLKQLKELGYIKKLREGVIERCKDLEIPYVFPSDEFLKIKKQGDK